VGRLRRASSCARWAGRQGESARDARGARFQALQGGRGYDDKVFGSAV
jgi:hypothetical protein